MSFKEDGVDSLGEVQWGGPSRVGQLGKSRFFFNLKVFIKE